MKVIILAGGLGTRISEETKLKPKPMVLLDDKPIIWHLMNSFALQGVTDFVIATGYLGHVIHDWVDNLDTKWDVKALDTGSNTMTGGRIRACMRRKQPQSAWASPAWRFSGNTIVADGGSGSANA
jgi:glucose-1-phosphate cytidylyltransferase